MRTTSFPAAVARLKWVLTVGVGIVTSRNPLWFRPLYCTLNLVVSVLGVCDCRVSVCVCARIFPTSSGAGDSMKFRVQGAGL